MVFITGNIHKPNGTEILINKVSDRYSYFLAYTGNGVWNEIRKITYSDDTFEYWLTGLSFNAQEGFPVKSSISKKCPLRRSSPRYKKALKVMTDIVNEFID